MDIKTDLFKLRKRVVVVPAVTRSRFEASIFFLFYLTYRSSLASLPAYRRVVALHLPIFLVSHLLSPPSS